MQYNNKSALATPIMNKVVLLNKQLVFYGTKVPHGVQFCGRVVYQDRIYTCNRTYRACKCSIRKAARNCSLQSAYRLQSSFNSYSGIMCHTYSFNRQRELMEMVASTDFSKWLYFVNRGGHMVCQIKDRYKPRNVRQKDLQELTKQQKQFEYERKAERSIEQFAA